MPTSRPCRSFFLWMAFALTCVAPAVGPTGSLVGSSDSSILVRDLTAKGGLAWVYWVNPWDRKKGGSRITTVVTLHPSGSTAAYCTYPQTLTWSDGITAALDAAGRAD